MLLAVGAVVYVSFGEWGNALSEERVKGPWQDPTDLGLDYWIITRVHFFGLFLGALGIIGLIVDMRKAKLIS